MAVPTETSTSFCYDSYSCALHRLAGLKETPKKWASHVQQANYAVKQPR